MTLFHTLRYYLTVRRRWPEMPRKRAWGIAKELAAFHVSRTGG